MRSGPVKGPPGNLAIGGKVVQNSASTRAVLVTNSRCGGLNVLVEGGRSSLSLQALHNRRPYLTLVMAVTAFDEGRQ